MTRSSRALVVAAVFAACAWSNRGAAQSGAELPSSYLAIKGGLGLGGTANVHNDAYLLTDSDEAPRIEIMELDTASDLNTSFGGQLEYLFGVHRFIGLGGLFGVRTWRSAAGSGANDDLSIGLDVGVVPQGRLPVGRRLEFYIALPISLTLSILNEYKTWTDRQHDDVGTALRVEPTYGYGIGLLAGARFAITGSFGLLAELGYQRYAFTHEVPFKVLPSLDDMGLGTDLAVDFVTEQARVSVGVFF